MSRHYDEVCAQLDETDPYSEEYTTLVAELDAMEALE